MSAHSGLLPNTFLKIRDRLKVNHTATMSALQRKYSRSPLFLKDGFHSHLNGVVYFKETEFILSKD